MFSLRLCSCFVFQATYSPYRDRIPLQIVRAEVELSAEERAYLTAVEKGTLHLYHLHPADPLTTSILLSQGVSDG